jgi:hypothetical protein
MAGKHHPHMGGKLEAAFDNAYGIVGNLRRLTRSYTQKENFGSSGVQRRNW